MYGTIDHESFPSSISDLWISYDAIRLAGLWSGAVVLLSGVMGVMAGKKRSMVIYIVSFLVTSILALAAVGLLLIFAATGLARDSDAPWGYFVDQEVPLLFESLKKNNLPKNWGSYSVRRISLFDCEM